LVLAKYALNHKYMFESPEVAFLTTYTNFLVNTLVELCNLIVIISSNSPLNIVLNFVAICIISEFDNIIYASQGNEYCTKMLKDDAIAQKILQIQHTTSKNCGVDELSNVEDEQGSYHKMKIVFKERTTSEKCLFILYKIARVWYIAIYAYWVPFFVIVLNILIP